MSSSKQLAHALEQIFENFDKRDHDINELRKTVKQLKDDISDMKSGYDQGWMKVELAAKKVGMKGPALRQRIINKNHTEGLVWRRSDTNQILVNLAEFRKVM